MTTHSLAIKQFVPPDGNPYNTDRVQISGGSRRTEEDSERPFYDIPVTHLPIYNGQVVDINIMLMCSRCRAWKLDEEFYVDESRTIRRGRCYYCKDCKDQMRFHHSKAISAQETPTKKRRKKRRKR